MLHKRYVKKLGTFENTMMGAPHAPIFYSIIRGAVNIHDNSRDLNVADHCQPLTRTFFALNL
jgi:hypothetical protein